MRIVVTGADGFIGRNLRRAAARAGPSATSSASRAASTTAELPRCAGATPTSCSISPASTGRSDDAEFVDGNVGLHASGCARRLRRRAAARRSCTPRRRRPRSTTPTAGASAPPRRRSLRYGRDDRRAGARVPAAPTCSASGAGRTTTRRSRRSATTSRAACRSPSTIRPRRCGSSTSTTSSTRSSSLLTRPAPAGFARSRTRSTRRPSASSPRHLQEFRRQPRRRWSSPRVGTGLDARAVRDLRQLPAAEALRLRGAAPCRPARRVRRDAEDAGLRPVLVFHRAARGHARRALSPHARPRSSWSSRARRAFGFRHIDDRRDARAHGARRRSAHRRNRFPGWAHDITNVGDDELIVMLWANEIFDRARPDTVAMKVSP